MKKIITIFSIASILFSCSPKDDNPEYTRSLLKVSSVTFPVATATNFKFAKDSVTVIPMTYIRPNNCTEFNGLYYSKNAFTRTVAIEVVKEERGDCPLTNITETTNLRFSPAVLGTYHFKFWKNTTAAGVDEFFEFDAIVNH